MGVEELKIDIELGCISDILKIGTLFPVFKNKGDARYAKNYRGITVTPIYSKIIEKIIKLRENPIILEKQNPLQRGFTENTTPLLCELIIEEFERESKDLKLPTYIALLDGIGGHISNISCCAPTCADDVAIIANNPIELQTLINIAVNFSRREGYTLQPTKSVILPVNTSSRSIEIEDNYWHINNNPMPVVDHSSHIAEIHLKALTLFGNITRANKTSVEWRLAERQLQLKTHTSKSWFIEIKKICLKYDLPGCQNFLTYPLGKFQWKHLITRKIYTYWREKINENSEGYSSLQHIACAYKIKTIHPILTTNTSNCRDINRSRIPIRTKVATGNYILQSNRAKFNKCEVSATCKICNQEDETIEHFLISCIHLEPDREKLLKVIREQCLRLVELFNISLDINLIHVIINPYHLVKFCACTQTSDLCSFISLHVEPACRTLIYNLHMQRYKLLNTGQKNLRKSNLAK
ncbi:unnamed protein product [Mytilus coruscus]|uniref:Reverse transcriptase domain-containing protein n=1 Tax=Mytilus coruscus TaxID=42192 RepID=A0A6J8EH52_MYTCO|nr:unnamed protein product [Mytilus coruscus]